MMIYFHFTKHHPYPYYSLPPPPPPPLLCLRCKTFSSRSFIPGATSTSRTKHHISSYSATPTTIRVRTSQAVVNALQNGDEFEGAVAPEDAIEYIKWLLNTMGDGRMSVSPYDTAWVALIPDDVNGHGSGSSPHFPSSLEWIVKNQLSDGSWGDKHYFSIYDCLLNTLASVIALQTWNLHPTKTQIGIKFIRENMWKLQNAESEHMTCGFELVFPALLHKARDLGIDLPYDSPVLKHIYERRDLKMTRIPKEVMHTVHTTILYSLEGIDKEKLDWEKLLKLQAPNGSFFTSPASTAFAAIETKDENCLRYLQQIVSKFHGGAPIAYPVDLFTRTFAIDRLQRLGISHFFQSEIKQCLDYVHSYWTKNGISHARDSFPCNVDDTAMGFMLLRLHGYNVSPDVFRKFKKGDEFCCYEQGQVDESLSSIFNLYRASQVLFPGDKILEDVKIFCHEFLKQRLSNNQLNDKWIIPKDLAAEVRFGLEVPWYASLQRVESRLYIEQYGGANDVWIAKTLYRRPEISNDVYLELARSEFNKVQAQHQAEWNDIVKWYEEQNLVEFGISRNMVLLAYFLATANKFEAEKMMERFAWTATVVICSVIKSYLRGEAISSPEQRIAFIKEFKSNLMNIVNDQPKINTNNGKNTIESSVLRILVDFLNQLSRDSFKRLGRDIRHQLNDVWQMWLNNNGGGEASDDAELIVNTLNLCTGSSWIYFLILSTSTFQLSLTKSITNLKLIIRIKRLLMIRIMMLFIRWIGGSI